MRHERAVDGRGLIDLGAEARRARRKSPPPPRRAARRRDAWRPAGARRGAGARAPARARSPRLRGRRARRSRAAASAGSLRARPAPAPARSPPRAPARRPPSASTCSASALALGLELAERVEVFDVGRRIGQRHALVLGGDVAEVDAQLGELRGRAKPPVDVGAAPRLLLRRPVGPLGGPRDRLHDAAHHELGARTGSPAASSLVAHARVTRRALEERLDLGLVGAHRGRAQAARGPRGRATGRRRASICPRRSRP